MWHDSNMLIAMQQWPFYTLHACSLPIQQQHSWRDPPYIYIMICSRHGMIYNMQMSHDQISISTLGEHPANSCRHVLAQLYRYAYGLTNFFFALNTSKLQIYNRLMKDYFTPVQQADCQQLSCKKTCIRACNLLRVTFFAYVK